MSYAVLRGHPTPSQLFLDNILDEIIKQNKLENKVKKREQINLAEILYYCMKQKPDAILLINGSSGEKVTYSDILKYAVSLAQVIGKKHEKGKVIMFLMRNHQYMAALFYAILFAGVTPLMIDPNATTSEIVHFVKLVEPYIVFCDMDRYKDVTTATSYKGNTSEVKVVGASSKNLLKEFAGGYWKHFDNFGVSEAAVSSTVLLIPTSGSTGLPKATILTHSGLIAQLPALWTNYQNFPKPTERVLLLSSAQWVTHTLQMLTCPVFGVSLLMTPSSPTTDHVLEIIEKYRPTWSLMNPVFLKSLAISGSNNQLSSFETIISTGSPLTQQIVNVIEKKLPASIHIGNGMGMTETHSFITMPSPGTDWQSNGKILNTFIYKIVTEDGTEVDAYERGELYIKSNLCVFKGYYKNEEAYRESVTPEGWFKTGDIFYKDESGNIYFVERRKFWFKYQNYHIAPEELERVISSVPDVEQCVVCDSEKGPAAAVVLRTDYNNYRSRVKELIHIAINDTLSDYKQLRGGVYFVSALPCTHSGKLKRRECSKLVQNLTISGNNDERNML